MPVLWITRCDVSVEFVIHCHIEKHVKVIHNCGNSRFSTHIIFLYLVNQLNDFFASALIVALSRVCFTNIKYKYIELGECQDNLTISSYLVVNLSLCFMTFLSVIQICLIGYLVDSPLTESWTPGLLSCTFIN